MKRLPRVIALASILIVAFCLAVWGQAAKIVTGQIQPFIIDITQSVPVEVSVPISGTDGVTMTLPLTVSVNLRVSIDTASRTATVETLPGPTPEVIVVQAGQELIDDLGLTYELILDSNELEITEWTVYESNNGWLSISGEIAMSDESEPFNEIQAIARAYKNDKLVKVQEISGGVGRELEPGGTDYFDTGITVQPLEIDRYTVEFTVLR